ncbi:MAG: hypothetical protein ILO53_04730 [Clostridia bacterium]|nr:hypothetical protein [Clostridia bacterium]
MNKKMLKYGLAAVLTLVLLLGAACTGGTNRPAETEIPTPTPVPRDISNDTPAAASVVYANQVANSVQAVYTSCERDVYMITNRGMALSYRLFGENTDKGPASFDSAEGRTYFTDSMDIYVIDSNGVEWSDRYSLISGRVNTTRLGYYYYETHVRDLIFGVAATEGNFEASTDILAAAGSAKGGIIARDGEAIMKSGKLEFTVKSAYDPYFVIQGFAIPKTSVNLIQITMTVSGTASTCELFIDDGGDFNHKQALKFAVLPDGKEHTYLVDISAIQGGETLKGVRFDIGDTVKDTVRVSAIRAAKPNSQAPKLKAEKIYHTFPDKLHQQFRVVSYAKIDDLAEMGTLWRVDKSKVSSLEIKDVNGTHGDLSFDPATVEYVAFDVAEAGVCGIIIPDGGSETKEVTVSEEGGFYVVRQKFGGKLSIRDKGDATWGNRLYYDGTHSFSGIATAAYLERNPLDASRITVTETNSSARYKGYDALRGLYVFTMKGTTFNTAYKPENHNRYYSASVTVENDSNERIVYMDFNSGEECIESGAILDGNGTLVPIPMEVCKNFSGEKEEPLYDPTDVPYSDTFFPLKLAANESLSFTQMHLYQNWGIFPLKQIGSIQFHVSYYHLSTGVTESNCIAPYFVYGRDGWTLPDFRGPSGIMWTSQPQFTAGGHNKFVSYIDDKGRLNRSEYTGSSIRSYGPTYADLEYSYKADSGKYEYTLRHMEFPQSDENRGYYTLSLKFLEDLTVKDVRRSFTLHYFDGRDQKFDKLSYLAEDGSVKTVVTDFSGENFNTVKLQKGKFWFALYGSNSDDPMNEAFVLKKYEAVLGGKAWIGNMVLRNGYDGVMYNVTELSLDLGKFTFKKGDTIYMEFLLVPWGNTNRDTCENVERLFEDSALKPLAVNVSTGRLAEEPFLPRIVCEGNAAEFSITGGRNRNAVRVDGFTKLVRPVIEKKNASGAFEKYDTSVESYDGYQVHFNPDGTYGYSFIFEQGSPDDVAEFRVFVD